MRILHISTRLILGGSQENTVLSCEGQARAGHEVHLAFGPIYGPEGSLLERVEKFRTEDGRGITTHVVPHLVRQISPLSDLRAEIELRRLTDKLKPDIVHTHSSKAGILGRAGAVMLFDDRPHQLGIVHTIHGPPFMPLEGSLLKRAKITLANALYTHYERQAAPQCHTIVSVADAMTRQFLERKIGKPSQYVTVRSGMETAPYLIPSPGEDRASMRVKLGFADHAFVVGTVARLAQHKGHDDLLDALHAEMGRDHRIKLLWVGDGWWKKRLLDKARGFGLRVHDLSGDNAGLPPQDAQLILTGLVPPERVPGLMRAMDVLAHPSYREGLPRTVPQALLAGVCPVAYNCDGTGEVCRDMETGRLVRTGNATALGEAILWLRDHPAERQAMAERGRDECMIAFSVETMLSGLEDVYAKAFAEGREAYEFWNPPS